MWTPIRTTVYIGYDIFFRVKVATYTYDKIAEYVEGLNKECNSIRKNCLQLAWAMRGGATYTDVLNMSHTERKLISDITEKNLEITKKSGLPYF